MASKAKSPRRSFFLHIHPERVFARSLKVGTTLGLGVISVVLLVLLLVTGLVLMLGYVPVPGLAYERLVDMRGGALPALGLIRDLHRLASDGLVICVAAHMARVFLTGSLGKKRRANWLVGVVLLLTTLATAFTGFLLPWDQNAYWAAQVGGELVGLVPGVGPTFRHLLWGGQSVSAETVVRAYAFHVAILPTLGTVLMAYHLWKIRKAGGLARPADLADTSHVAARPALTMRALIIALFVLSALLVLASIWDAPLGGPGHPPRPLDPAKAPWFFLWIQELVSYSTVFGGAVPLVLCALLLAAPFLEKRDQRGGQWFGKGRRARCILFIGINMAVILLTCLAAWYRGPGWRLMLGE